MENIITNGCSFTRKDRRVGISGTADDFQTDPMSQWKWPHFIQKDYPEYKVINYGCPTNDNEVIQAILNTHNKIANLQLIPKSCNRKKQDKFITVFVNGCISEGDRLCLNNQSSAIDYYNTNFIDILEDTNAETYLNLSNYKLFYERRKNRLKTDILLLLNN